ncbi:MAG TPA: hypothetical protein EYG13_03640, partial [Dehalococcoidia bacterium]|nr:hypothetical protein [Dehalococcoidia bacterium]
MNLMFSIRNLAAVCLVIACSPLALNADTPDSVVVFNEIHYNPVGTHEIGEWIELFNQMGIKSDISGWRLAGGVDYTFPQGTILDPGEYLVIYKSPGRGQLGPLMKHLANDEDRITLINQSDRLMDELVFGDSGRWPVAADGSGVTLAKRKPYTSAKPPENWSASAQLGGTPGTENFPGADTPPPTTTVSLFGLGSMWRYNESDVELPAHWATTAHPVSSVGWMSGPDPIGNESSITTPISTLLTFPGFRVPYVITYYFEKEFTLTAGQAAGLQSLQLRHLIDDGAVFYLNGVEVFRLNMPAGPIHPETEAGNEVEVDLLSIAIPIPAGAAVAGQNRLSVELHQDRVGSSDIVFGVELDAVLQGIVPGAALPLVLNEMPSAAESNFWIELINDGPASIDVDGIVLSVNGDPEREFTLPAQSLAPGVLLLLTESELGFRPTDGERVFVYNPTRTSVTDAQVVTGSLRGRAESREMAWLYPATATPGAVNDFKFNEDIVISEIAYNPPALPATSGTQGTFETPSLIDFGELWRYNDGDENFPANWATAAHAIGGNWKSGATVIAQEASALPEPVRTPLQNYSSATVTYYFEREFDLTAQELAVLESMVIMHEVDDGAIFYLNGVEVGRYNMPEGAVGPETLSTTLNGSNATLLSLPISTHPLVVGQNRVSVEVHQSSTSSSDMVFGLRLETRVTLTPAIPGMPFRNSRNQWIEIANKSFHPVDISSWEFNQGIDFEFGTNTWLAAGEHACLARDSDEFSAAFPSARLLGEFDGSLSRNGERISLRDAHKNPVDLVRFYDSGHWPDAADGGGSSLELRDLGADNNVAEAWADSDETAQTGWRTYTYRRTLAGSRGPDTKWSEFNMGLLGAGEILIDDIRVVEDPDVTAVQKINNTSFSGGVTGWRFRGNHRHSEVIKDPDNSGNNVLRLVATGGTEHMHNQIETTLLSVANNGRVYEISFRARWVRKSNQLHTRLYFNRMALSTVIDRPEHVGTPSAPNTRAESNIGPTITEFLHTPAVPAVSEPVMVKV